MPLLQQPAQPAQIGVGVGCEHRLVMHDVVAHHLGQADAVPASFNQAAPEIEIFPSFGDVGVATNVIPGRTAHQCHGINVVAVQKAFLLPKSKSMQALAHERVVVLFLLNGNPRMDHGAEIVTLFS